LFYLAERRELKAQADWLPHIDRILLNAATLPDSASFRQCIAELIADRSYLSTTAIPRTAAEFDEQRRTGNERMGRAVQEVAALLEPLLAAYQQALVAVESAAEKGWDYAAADMRLQLQELTSAGFLTRTPWNWLQQLPRYLDGIRRRLHKLAGGGGGARDKEHHAVIQPRWQAYRSRAAEHRQRGVYDPELIQYRWMLEELRISLFVQELGTSVTISPQRLDKQGAKVKA
jgi:ATP-dependent helicase HrpA